MRDQMQKFICIGDVHAQYDLLWQALHAAGCAGRDGMPTKPVLSGRFQVVLIGDLVHPKSWKAYEELTELSPFDIQSQSHLLTAARLQIEGLRKIKLFQEAAPHAIHPILGNHDDNILRPTHVLGTSGGLKHIEFDPSKGGAHLPEDLREWMSGFLRELRIKGLQFAHVSPLPNHHYYDDFFYSDKSHKQWFKESPYYVPRSGLEFGVYGHTQTEGIHVLRDEEEDTPLLAMIDALSARQYLEIFYNPAQDPALRGLNIISF